MIECKDQNERVDVEKVEAFTTKIRRLKAAKGVMVSRSGFTHDAKIAADEAGIDLLTASESSRVDLKKFKSVPLIVTHIEVLASANVFRLTEHIPNSLQLGRNSIFNEIPMAQIFLEAYRAGKVKERLKNRNRSIATAVI